MTTNKKGAANYAYIAITMGIALDVMTINAQLLVAPEEAPDAYLADDEVGRTFQLLRSGEWRLHSTTRDFAIFERVINTNKEQ